MLITIISSIRVKPRLRRLRSLPIFYQSLYLVPSSAVSCDFVYTSKTLSPSQESEVGIILHRVHAPFGFARHWVYRYSAQKF